MATDTPAGLNPDNELCARCGQVARGYAQIGGHRYCHADERPSCYEQAQWEGVHLQAEEVHDGRDDKAGRPAADVECPHCGLVTDAEGGCACVESSHWADGGRCADAGAIVRRLAVRDPRGR